MGEVLIKPYELSIWDNELTNTEQKIAVIGSHLLKTPNMAYDIVFTKNKNGEKTLSFKVKYKYFDADTGQMEDNPFAPYLINERKVKLFYDDEWYDFIIKEVEETSDEYTCSYTAYDAFILELSKNGYGIEFSSELNNNLGTALDLATKTLEDTDWLVIDVDTAPPKVNEPVFEARLLTDVTVKNMDNDEDTVITANEEVPTEILIFYSFISNQNGKYLQFILKQNNISDYNIDSTNIITATNYRFDKELTFETVEEGGHTTYYIKDGNTRIISYSYVYQLYEAYRLVYQQVNSYDAVMDRIVDQYTDGPNVINHYTDYVYTTSNLVTSFVANGDNFSTYEDGTLYGWDRYGGNSTDWPEIELTTYPEINPENPIVDLDSIKQLEGYLQVKFEAGEGSYLYNDGILNNKALIESIAKGDKFVFRWRGGKASTDHGTLTKMAQGDIRAKVCFYKEVRVEDEESVRYAKVPTSDIVSFSGTAEVLNNVISGGTLQHNNEQYILDGVEQVPSSKYLYATDLNRYYWDGTQGKYIIYNEQTNQTFLDYYYLTGTAVTAVTEEQFEDPLVHLGIFIYCNGNINNYYYLQDVQLTRLYRDAAGTVLTVGNVPSAIASSTDYYYMAPKEGDTKNKISLFLSLEDLANEYELNIENIKPVYNQGNILFTDTNDDIFWVKKEQLRDLYEQFEVQGYSLSKVSTIEASRSNYFNILQTIAETFECWIDIYVEHNADGSIYLDEDGKPLKTILLREFSGKDNFAGFKYGINIDQISRTVDSNEIVTKLIVDDSNSDIADDGVISIAQAESNPSKEQYIYRFDYFLNQGLLPRDEFTQELNDLNFSLKQLNTTLYDLQQQSNTLSNSLLHVSSSRTIYGTLLTTAHEKMNDALDEFEDITGYPYEEYLSATDDSGSDNSDSSDSGSSVYDDPDSGDIVDDDSDDKELPYEVDKVKEIIGTIYNCAATENSYRGLYTNLDTEYLNLHQQLNGIQEHAVTAVCVQSETAWYLRVKVDDYIVPFKFYVDGVEYETSLTTKNFDIEINSNEVDITDIVYNTNSETGYQLLDSNDNPVTTIHATSNVLQTFRLVPNSPTDGLNSEIDALIKQKRELIREFSIKYQRFILEGNWSSQDYLSDELYYLDAALAGRTSAFPKVTYNINVVDVSGLNDYQAYNFNAGEKTYIEDTEFFGWTYIDGVKTPVKEEVIISDIEWHLDDPSQNSITIQNYKDHFEDLFQKVQSTVQTVQYNEVTYPNTGTIIDEEKRINQALLLASLSRVAGMQRPLTTDGSIVIDGDSIDILNLSNRLNRVRLSSEGITISSDGGYTWSAAITGEGINIGNVISDFINTKEIWIGSKDSPSFRWDKNGISAFMLGDESQGQLRYNFKKFVRYDQYGLYGIDLTGSTESEYIVSGIDDIKNKASFAVTWDGFFIKNKYAGGGQVEITSMDDIRVLGNSGNEIIKIGALEWLKNGGGTTTDPRQAMPNTAPQKYGIRIKNSSGQDMFVTGNDGNLSIMNTVRIGAVSENDRDHIIIEGDLARIRTSTYTDGAGIGWMINKDGDAFFNNITARGAIKTAVFEYAEIQAIGGVFLFRPSSTIRSATVSGNNLVITVDNPAIFKINQYVKVSNYYTGNYGPDQTNPNTDEILQNNGLLNIYKISSIFNGSITLLGAAVMVGQGLAVEDVNELVGGALVDMGNAAGTSNYGIGINSSDNTVNLPARAISLFNTTVNTSATGDTPKVTYEYTGILGTLPVLTIDNVNNDNPYDTYMVGTQGIYTDNMYIGDANQYIAFYTDKESTPAKHMIIKAKEFTLETEEESETNGYIYLSNTNKYRTGDQNTAWRFIIGPNFRVTSSGNLYAANANISGNVIANTLSSGGRTGSSTGHAGTYIASDGAIYVGSNNDFMVTADGVLTAKSGTIGNWHIEPLNNGNYTYGGALYTDNYSIGSGVLISPGYTTTSTAIEGSSTEKTWTITAGSGFGVTTSGKLYANNAKISGNITATTGKIGNWNIESPTNNTFGGALYTDNYSFGSGVVLSPGYTPPSGVSTTILDADKTWAFIAGDSFGVTTSGELYADAAHLSGLTVTSDKIEYSGSTYAQVTSTGLKIYNGGNLKGEFGSTINLYGGNSAGGTYPKTEISANNVTIANDTYNKIIIDTEGMHIWVGGRELTTYGSDGIDIGGVNISSSGISLSSSEFTVFDNYGYEQFSIGTSNVSTTQTITQHKSVAARASASSSRNVAFTCPINMAITFELTREGGSSYLKRVQNYTISASSSGNYIFSGDINDMPYYLKIKSVGSNQAMLILSNGTTAKLNLAYSYEAHSFVPLITSSGSLDLGGAINVTADSTFTNNLTVDKNLTVNGIIYGQPSSNQFAINSTTRVRAHYNDSYSMWIGRGTEDGQWTTNRGLYDTYTSAWIIYKNDNSNIHFSKDANVYCHGHCRPNSNATYDLGGSSYRWDTLYVKSTNVSGSDRKEKDILGPIDFAKDLIMGLEPIKYMWKNGDHRRTRMGFVAQDTAKQCKQLGLNLSLYTASYKTTTESADESLTSYYGEDVDDELLIWGMSYEELIAPIIQVIQDQQKEINQLKQDIQLLRGNN